MGVVAQDKMVIGFVVQRNVLREIDKHAKNFKSRSEFVGASIELCLENKKVVQAELMIRVMEAVGALLVEAPKAGDEKLVPVQAVMAKTSIEQVDRFADKMRMSRVAALATLVEIGMKQQAVLLRTAVPAIKAVKVLRRKKSVEGGAGGAKNAQSAYW